MNPIDQFIQQFPKTEQNKPLAPFTSFHIGGPADLYYKLTDLAELEPLLKTAQQLHLNYVVLGGGSNTIFADAGFRGVVIHIQAHKIALEEPSIVAAEAGALLSQVVQFALKHNLSGMEKLMGLPGTIGGAVRGNAGAFGTEIKDIFAKALIYSPSKGLYEATKEEMQFAYRSSVIKQNHDIVLKIYLTLEQKDSTASKQALAEALDIVKNRISKQPKGYCSGSFFKNPDPHDDHLKAGYLLDQAGCKGLQVGGVKVSDQHANWLMNVAHGSQKDVIELCKILQDKVKKQSNIDLEREVQLMSETGYL